MSHRFCLHSREGKGISKGVNSRRKRLSVVIDMNSQEERVREEGTTVELWKAGGMSAN